MSLLILSVLLIAQSSGSPPRTTLSNDHPEFPIGFAKDAKLLENVNQSAIKNPLGVKEFMEEATKRGELLSIPSGTKAKTLSTHKLRGPMFKEIVQVEVTQGDQKGLRGWVCSGALVSDEEYAKIAATSAGTKPDECVGKPLYRDPIPGDKAYLAPQPTMFGTPRSLIRLAVAGDSAANVFQEWQGATETSRDSVLRRLEAKRALFVTTYNTEVKVQKVFPEQMINGIYPVQVELQSGQFKGKVGWAPVTVVSPVPGVSATPAQVQANRRTAELQKTLDQRKQAHQQRSKYQAQVTADMTAEAEKAREQQIRQQQVQGQLQLQMLQQQAAVAEARAVNERTNLYRQMSQNLRQQQVRDAYNNGEGVVYSPNGAMTMDEYLRNRNQ